MSLKRGRGFFSSFGSGFGSGGGGGGGVAAGALPPALAIGPGAELQRPMAIALVGGMLVSTALTLFVVPAAYSVFDDVIEWNAKRRRSGTPLVAALKELRPANGRTLL